MDVFLSEWEPLKHDVCVDGEGSQRGSATHYSKGRPLFIYLLRTYYAHTQVF